jgi:glycosyltransferase involved in cell wall biosynthesis
VAVLGSLPESLINFRGPLLAAMLEAGHEVHALSPPADAPLIAALAAMGVRHHAVPLARTGLNPFRDLISLRALVALFRGLRPDCLFAYTIKPVIYGGIAARWAGVPRFYAMITGLGYTMTGSGPKGRLLAGLARGLYRVALSGAERVFFQNPDDLAVFQASGLLRPDQPVLINGSGVDLDRFAPVALPAEPSFLMIARLLRDKGVVEYVEAARQVKARYPGIGIRLVGWIDNNPAAISKTELDQWVREGVVEYLGYLDDVRPAIAGASIYCLPSYHEGTPRTVLEAMAMGRAVVTTDVPGCRSTVLEGENGFLVPPRDSQALAGAMERFVTEPRLIPAMGEASRRLATERFDVREINRVLLGTMGLQREAVV